MKLCAVQVKAAAGDIAANITHHCFLVERAVKEGIDLIVFPELSITGYEPTLAGNLAFPIDDARLDRFQALSDSKKVIIGVGIPLRLPNGVSISIFFFQPGRSRQVHCKTYLHADEEPFFISAPGATELLEGAIAPAICYELSVGQHAKDASAHGAATYLVSTAKTKEGMTKAIAQLEETSRRYSMNILLSNCIGECDNFLAAGQSCAFDNKGTLMAKLDDRREGWVILDTVTNETRMFQF